MSFSVDVESNNEIEETHASSEDKPPYSSNDKADHEELPNKSPKANISSPLLFKHSADYFLEGDNIAINLNNRGTRLTIWAIAYFIFSIAEFSANAVVADNTYWRKLQSAYQTWAASDFFLLIAASLLFIECNPKYILNDIGISNGDNVHKIIGYISCGLFAFGGFLRWIALGQHNGALCNSSWCNSWHFAQDYMATWFSFVIAVDILNLFDRVDADKRALRMIVYCSLMFLAAIIVFSHYDHINSEVGGIGYTNAAITGWFFIWFLLIIILIIAILKLLGKYDGLNISGMTKKYLLFGIAVAMNISLGLAYYSGALLLQALLGIVVIEMIICDLMSLNIA